MTKILAITNQKGGVGKTTTSVNLAASLAAADKCVLLVDLDPQGNATMGSGTNKQTVKTTVYHVLLGHAEIQQALVSGTQGKYDLIPANRDLAGAEVEMVDFPQREARLKTALQEITQDRYRELPEYRLVKMDDNGKFVVELYVHGKKLSTGVGNSRANN